MHEPVKIEEFSAGHYEKINDYQYFVPNYINRQWLWSDTELSYLLEKASTAIGELNSFSDFVPDLDIFLQLHLTNEAVNSSKIEGTKTEIDEALLEEEDIDLEKRDDWHEVQNYRKAMAFALEKMKELPLSSRLLRETHKVLLAGVRGKYRNPGQFRRSQNWIGGSTPQTALYVPPLHSYIPDLMTDLESFIHNNEIFVPDLIKVGIIHYQFEAIHPFLDGNGRIGRLLITLYLIYKEVLDKPLLALSIFFEKNRFEYYRLLNEVATKNNLLDWLKFFLTGIREASKHTIFTIKEMLKLKREFEKILQQTSERRAANALRMLSFLFRQPIVKTKDISQLLSVTYNTAKDLINMFMELNILEKRQLNKKENIYVFTKYLKLFEG